ncbi:uncharacterized protein Z518_03471 [Rhinocladiella mackenziei CBS 650.93]|uniref:Rhinocladiella mackenziei CBS 650.93 unplaced genomic scaffold supercont1.6, whole genome shotgun sequence n=1 Tax=Rhinocladiella mackenziei CBS 650.93 TaxID=1442369 RepID=A0A0D2I9N1_9EURO|nr:uncharacterized protein Z518_08500 [Rhinocladiella mackenziei CBS 650.93]XP_013275950.1 uncharacterized protein Z518_03471 [Rhinocladiella mackenziei CBS 650.93]KIX02559.1 hypothetical protein Z518_08500 [Rhinocladiella mackenziei CBS 650.93]KIX08814.1 hypothetical protein Z518_03471 [Rhinocladiella mackenziei CBS 650.93]
MEAPQNPRFSTPEFYQFSSDDDDFKSARESLSSISDVSENWTGFSPGTAENPIDVESAPPVSCPSFSDSFDDEIEIPAPKTLDQNGEKLQWDSLDLAFEALQAFAKENGFAVKKHTRKLRDGRVVMQYINCVRGGQRNTTKVSTPNRKRRSKSLIAENPCQFRACLKEVNQTRQWVLELLEGSHNHVAADESKVFAVHRRNARKAQPRILQQIHADVEVGIETKRSWHSIRKMNPTTPITLQDVRNQRYRYSAVLDEGLPAIQALIRDLDGAFAHQEVLDEYNHLVHILFFQYSSLQLLRRWPFALAIDCTYKTNRHGLYLCQIIGMTSLNTSFVIGQAFLSNEDKEAFVFVLRWLREFYIKMSLPSPTSITTDKAGGLLAALKEVWPQIPHLICVWHVNNDVEAHCKVLWRRKYDNQQGHMSAAERKSQVDNMWKSLLVDWRQVIYATSEIECDNAWGNLYTKWIEDNKEVVVYLRDTWMSCKERFCEAWTSFFMHFGNATTSRVESMHKAVKSDLPHRQSHLRGAIRTFQAYNERLNEQTEHRLADERIRIDLRLRHDSVFFGLHTRISSFALKKVLEHVEYFKRQPFAGIGCCTNRFTRQWGLPCAHLYHQRKALRASLEIDDFHAQWRLETLKKLPPIDPLYLLKDPVKVRSRLEAKSNKRELSLVEVVRNEGLSVSTQDSQMNQILPNQRRITIESSQQVSTTTSSLSSRQEEASESRPRITHHPASIETILKPLDDLTPLPLYHISMGDDIELGGFRMASELVNWEQYHGLGGASFARQWKNETAWCPDPQAFKHRPEENFEWSSDEEDYFADLKDDRIVKYRAESVVATRQKAEIWGHRSTTS